ncbi:MAG: PAS domain S-box protein [Betaproteobacteria bacterium]|nr:PAS domain S-box protein [Betaproteobacteria bacterium]
MSTAALPPPAASPPSGSRLWRLMRWWMPVVIGGLLLGATSFLVNLSSVQERGEANDQLVTDTQWVRQSLQFQLEHDAEALELIGSDLRTGAMAPAALEARLRVFLRRGRESLSASLVEAGQAAPLLDVRDASVGGQDILATVPAVFIEAAMERAARQSEGTFGQPFTATWGAGLVLVVPAGLGPTGARRTLVAVFSLERLLEEMVPWTFAQSHEVIVSDVTNTVKARRASAGAGRGIYTHQVALDVPGTTLILRTNSVKGPPDWIANVLRGGVIALAFFLFWSLYALWADVRRRVKAENRLRDEVAFRRAMGDSAVIGLRARDMEGRVTFVNPAFARMVGLSEEALVGRTPPMPYWTPERLDEYQERVERVLSGQASAAPFETVFQRADGTRFPVVIYDAPLMDADGKQVGWMSSIIDVTEEKKAEERERQQQERLQTAARLTTMGEMASSLAHELNQPLGAITSYLTGSINLLEKGDVSKEELAAALAKASAQAQRAGQVIRRVHEFVRKQEPKRVPVEVTALLDDCRALIDLQARRDGVRVAVTVEPDLPPVYGDPVLLEQVILNLTRNGIDAMAGCPPERRRLEISAARLGAWVRIAVRDYGSGIDESLAEQVFSPFFTTKSEGMGMGLSICRSIIELHDGRLGFRRLADGTEFHLQLPPGQ